MEQIPQKLQNQLMQFQQTQQQAQAIATQRIQLDLQLKEVEHAFTEVGKLGKGAEIYKNVGAILMRSKVSTIREELQEKKETLELRIKTLQRQEGKVQQRLKDMQERIQEELKASKVNIGSAG